ncbi:YtxH domain-containing protein [Cytophagaceae bacterium DM2B3-1]|uniref:YtxH domain-containing protein n=1 Tax=Xanthocytophaga flava TaxID=3048013 RepID=A0AAE3QRE6_9BACT|nr:YtxH domain-containing protein [Xanthocytophaga flavus]MDJ1472294.1 YtxH domain-containing protein [Xanthocytophaga flavus]MDJ1482053.1 YtxH domain-containing protein [Xanthocytophaga flavus]MDJ1492305.1 YtxH domain-containing protein [Xanthocytophaga flavus]
MSNNGKIFLGIVAAAASGAIIGMLFAPDKGSGLRKKISESLSDWTDEVVKAVAKSKDTINSTVDKASTKVKSAVEEGANYANHAKSSSNV